MKLRMPLLLAGCAATLVSRLPAETKPDFPALCAHLGDAPKPHPYLIFDEAGKAAILAKIHQDQGLSELMEKIRLEGRRLMYATYQPPAPPRDPHTRYTGSDEYVRYMDQEAKAALTLAFLYQMTGDKACAEKAFEHADHLCALDSWVQSAHRFEVIYTRVWPYGVPDDRVVFTYDITSAAMTRDLSYVYDWLYPVMTKAQRDRIRSGLLEKAVTRVRGSYDYFWWSHAVRCNWSGICHSGLGLAALTLLHEDPGLVDVVARSCDGVWNMMEHVGPDGGWQEGRGYWAYGMGESAMFMDAIKRATDGRINFFRHRALYPHPADFALYGLTAGFGDGTGMPVGNSFFINKLAAESGDGRAAWYRRQYVRPSESVFDLIWTDPGIPGEAPKEASRWFHGIDWAVMRGSFRPSAMTIATKAGMNDDPHHGHMDNGTFTLTWQGVNYIGEVPRSSYDEQYFGADRWDHLEAATEGHNVVLVDGEEQVCAKEKDQPWKEGIGGKIMQYHSSPDLGYVELHLTHAYPRKHLKLWHRWIVLDKGYNVAVILDRVASAPGAKVEVLFHPNVPFQLSSTGAFLSGAGGADAAAAAAGRGRNRRQAQATPAAQHAFYSADAQGRRGAPDLEWSLACNQAVKTVQGRQPDLPITEEPQFTWIPYFSAVAQAGSTDTMIASVLGEKGKIGRAQLATDADGKGWTVSFETGGVPTRCHLTEQTVEWSGGPRGHALQ